MHQPIDTEPEDPDNADELSLLVARQYAALYFSQDSINRQIFQTTELTNKDTA